MNTVWRFSYYPWFCPNIGNKKKMSILLCFRLYVYTRTDQADSRRGYRIKYFTGCSVLINRANGTIESPAFGVGRYPASQVM